MRLLRLQDDGLDALKENKDNIRSKHYSWKNILLGEIEQTAFELFNYSLWSTGQYERASFFLSLQIA